LYDEFFGSTDIEFSYMDITFEEKKRQKPKQYTVVL
jgi:hypothetical protein